MRKTDDILKAAVIGLGLLAGGLWLFARPKLTGVPTANPPRNECVCGEVQTCAFGPGVVGEQVCETGPGFLNRWSRCEPKQEP